MEKILIHYAEIALKGKNRADFEGKLARNIKKSAESQGANLISLKRTHNLILCDFDCKSERINEALNAVFGISNFSYVHETDRNINAIESEAEKLMHQFKEEGNSKIAFDTKRSDKKFPLNSLEINKRFGAIANKLGLKVDYRNSPVSIFTEITSQKAYLYTGKIKGYDGLPVGSSGRVLCLLSGGIDSPVAAWQMMKRGCLVDFLHVHSFRSNDAAAKSKIKKLISVLNKYQFGSKLYLEPYTSYEFHSMDKGIKDDLVLFRHYLLKLAEKIALEKGYKAIVTGDNLGQVASQTLENMSASSYEISLPIFRPLLTFNKQEIINLAKEIKTYEISIEEYKDCCSILARHPKTKTKIERFKEVLEKADIKGLVEKSMKELTDYSI